MLTLFVLTSFVFAVPTSPGTANSVSYYNLDSDATDSNPNSYDLTASGATQATGILNNGYSFDGSNDKLSNSVVPIDVQADFSINFWFKTSTASTMELIHIRDTSTTGGADIYITSLGNIAAEFLQTGGTRPYAISSTTYNDGNWHMVTIWMDNADYVPQIYVDGTEVAYYTHQGGGTPYASSTGTTTVGEYSTGIRDFTGSIDEISIFDDILSDSEIEYLYNSGSPGEAQQYPFTGTGNAFEITAVDVSDDSNITTFSVNIDGYIYNTTNGTIITELLTNESTVLYELNISADGYYNESDSSVNISSNYQFNLTPKEYFNINAKNLFNGTNISTYSVDIDGYIYNTTNGTIITEILTNDLNLYNLSFISNEYFNQTALNVNITSPYLFWSYQNWFVIEAREVVTNNTLYGMTFNYSGTNQTDTTQFYGDANVERTIVSNENGSYYSHTNTYDGGDFGANDTIYFYLGTTVYNVSAIDIEDNPVTGFSVDVTVENTSQTFSYSSGSDSYIEISLLANYNYTFTYSHPSYSSDSNNTILTAAGLNDTVVFLSSNTIQVNLYDELTEDLINQTNMTVQFFSSDGGNITSFTTDTGVGNISLLTPATYQLRYYSTDVDDYKLRFTTVTLADKEYQEVDVYALNESDTGITTVNIKFIVFDQNLDLVEGATVSVSRFYPSQSGYVDIWNGKTNANGEVLGLFESIDAFYVYRVTYNGESKFVSDTDGVQFKVDGEIRIPIHIGLDFKLDTDNYYQSFSSSDIEFVNTSNTTGYFTYTWQISSGTASVCMSVRGSGYGNDHYEEECQIGTGGSFTELTVNTSGRFDQYYYATTRVKISDEQGYWIDKQETGFLNPSQGKPETTDFRGTMLYLGLMICLAVGLLTINKHPKISVVSFGLVFLVLSIKPLDMFGIGILPGISIFVMSLFVAYIMGDGRG